MLPESVFLAIQQLDGFDFRDNHILTVKEAEFSPPSSTTSSSKIDNNKSQRAKKVKRMQERALLSWNEETFTTKESALLIVVLKGMFIPEELCKRGSEGFVELEQDLVEGLQSICPTGDEIKKITIFKSHPEAVILIRFKDAVIALQCVELMNGRYFDGRKIEAALWDGVTEYAPREGAEEKARDEVKRMKEYQEWLENQED